MTDLTPARLMELLEAGKRFAGDPNLYRPRFFDIVTRKDGVERRYEGEWVRDVMRDLPSLAARVIELEGEVERLASKLKGEG